MTSFNPFGIPFVQNLMGDMDIPSVQDITDKIKNYSVQDYMSNPMAQWGANILAANEPGTTFGNAVGKGFVGASQMAKAQSQAAKMRSQAAKIKSLKDKISEQNSKNSFIDSLDIDPSMKEALKNDNELFRLFAKKQYGLDVPSQARKDWELNKAQAGKTSIVNNVSGNTADEPISGKDSQYYIDPRTGEQATIVPGESPSQAAERGLVFGKPPTSPERDAAAFASRMQDTESRIDSLEPESGTDPMFIADEILDYVPFGNFFKTEKGQKRKAERYNWIMSNVRDESGATINPDEVPMYEQSLFTQPGDGESTSAAKKQLRKSVLNGMYVKSGRLGSELRKMEAKNANDKIIMRRRMKELGLVPVE